MLGNDAGWYVTNLSMLNVNIIMLQVRDAYFQCVSKKSSCEEEKKAFEAGTVSRSSS